LRLASGKALDGLLALMRRHLAGTAELHTAILGPLAALASSGRSVLAPEARGNSRSRAREN
jgi:hypothetical protein